MDILILLLSKSMIFFFFSYLGAQILKIKAVHVNSHTKLTYGPSNFCENGPKEQLGKAGFLTLLLKTRLLS